jgi:hypothetical protein
VAGLPRAAGCGRIGAIMATERPEPSAPAEDSRSGRLPSALGGFLDRRHQAWERIHALEEIRDSPAGPDADRVVREARDLAGMERLWGAARAERNAAGVEAHRARRRAMLRFELPIAVMGLVVLGALAALNYLWLGALGVDYFESYLRDGFQVALVFGVVGAAINLDSKPGLVAAHPAIYVREVFVLGGYLSGAFSALFGPQRSERALAEARLADIGYRFRLRTFDLAFSWLFMLSFGVAMLAWAVVIAPLQYWVNLVCGAPSREALASSRTLWIVERPKRIELRFAPMDPNESQRRELEKAGKEGKMTRIGFAEKPVTLTSAIATAALFGISQLA